MLSRAVAQNHKERVFPISAQERRTCYAKGPEIFSKGTTQLQLITVGHFLCHPQACSWNGECGSQMRVGMSQVERHSFNLC